MTGEQFFAGVDLETFWADGEYADETYTCGYPTDEVVASVEAELGFRLPGSYVALMRTRNGGIPRDTCCPAPSPTTWSEDHVAVHVDQEVGYRITVLAPDFAGFVQSLRPATDYDAD